MLTLETDVEAVRAELGRRRRNFSPALGEVRRYHALVDQLAELTGEDVHELRTRLWLEGKSDDERAEAEADAASFIVTGDLATLERFERSSCVDQLRAAWRARMAEVPLISTLEADCPWPFSGNRRRGGAGRHYKLLSVADLCAYPLPPLARDCRLFLWRVGAMQQAALDVMSAWGFTQKAEIVWIKTTKDGMLIIDQTGDPRPDLVKLVDDGKNPATSLHFGMGHQVRYAHETCLIGVRGNPKRMKHVRSVFFAPVGEHSEKPAMFYDIVNSMSPGPRYSLFSRSEHPGWMSDGDELEGAFNL